MARPVTLYTLQWGDLSLETVCQKAKEFGYDGGTSRSCGCPTYGYGLLSRNQGSVKEI